MLIPVNRRTFLGVAASGLSGLLLSRTFANVLTQTHPTPGSCLTADEHTLAQLINEYRAQNGLASIPVSKSLCEVAQYHVIDLETNNPDSGTDSRGMACNTHSWSNKGPWTPVCYTGDHQYASGMWDKPKEITNNVYNSPGYEIAYGGSGSFIATPQGALNGWKSSQPHNEVLLNQGIWAEPNTVWRAMGVGIYGSYAVTWFGELTDPQGTLVACSGSTPTLPTATPTTPTTTPTTPQDKRIFLPTIRS